MILQQGILTGFAQDVEDGLSAKKKYLSSKYFYDDAGSRIFRQIMEMPEYYLTDCEFEVFRLHKSGIAEEFRKGNKPFDLIELGAGDGSKTAILLRYFLQNGLRFRYIPIDISAEAIRMLSGRLSSSIPELLIEGKTGDYFEMIESLNKYSDKPKIIFFLGSNIGNFSHSESVAFFRNLRINMHNHDKLFVGFDLKKNPEIIKKAYDDPHGYTRDFNLNVLRRINRELGADFHLDNFIHAPHYDAVRGIASSSIVSIKDQVITIKALNKKFLLSKWEAIHTEISVKYDEDDIVQLAAESGFSIVENYYDSRHYYLNSLWETADLKD